MKTINQAILTLALTGSVLAQEYPKAISHTSGMPSQGIWGIPLNNHNTTNTRTPAAPAATQSLPDNIWPIALEPNGKGTSSKGNGIAFVKPLILKVAIPQPPKGKGITFVKRTKPTVTIPQRSDLVGAILSHDLGNDFFVINRGSHNGINIADQFLITDINSPKALGYIEITRVQPSVSIAVYKKGFPRPSVPFQNGYKVWKSSLYK